MIRPSLLVTLLLTVSAVGCGGASVPDDTTDTSSDVAPLLAGTKLSESEIAGYLSDAGFDRDAIPQMVCTAKYESSYYTEALHRNANGSTDYGLFQINDELWAHQCHLTVKGLYDPAKNAVCAKRIYDYGGLTQWYGYKKHRRECDGFQLGNE